MFIAEEVVYRVHPLVRETSRSLRFSQIDCGIKRFVMRLWCIFPALAACAEGKAELAVKRQGFRRDVYDIRKIHQCVIRFIEVKLPLVLLYIIPELNAAEAKSLHKHLRRNVLPVAPVFSRARIVHRAALVRYALVSLPARFELVTMFADVSPGFFSILKRPSKFDIIASYFFPDKNRLSVIFIKVSIEFSFILRFILPILFSVRHLIFEIVHGVVKQLAIPDYPQLLTFDYP